MPWNIITKSGLIFPIDFVKQIRHERKNNEIKPKKSKCLFYRRVKTKWLRGKVFIQSPVNKCSIQCSGFFHLVFNVFFYVAFAYNIVFHIIVLLHHGGETTDLKECLLHCIKTGRRLKIHTHTKPSAAWLNYLIVYRHTIPVAVSFSRCLQTNDENGKRKEWPTRWNLTFEFAWNSQSICVLWLKRQSNRFSTVKFDSVLWRIHVMLEISERK